MRIRYRRTGGIANVKIECEIDSDTLPANWEQTLRASHGQGTPQSDEFVHELKLENGTKYSCTDSNCTPELMALFDQIYAHFLTQRRNDAKK